ncbi:Oxidase ustYa [Colletotrichum sp. SAR 10_99]|nr:Oxidase ustYa [Colletotrichum sp. SAR 10_99]
MGRDASKAVKINDGKGGYAGMLDIFHHLHCLRMIRIGYTLDLYPAYQPMLSSQMGELVPMHIDHCIDELRQAVMCRADVTVLTSDWIDWHPKPWLNFNVEHECVNWDKVFQWSKEHWYDIKKANLVHPHFGPVDWSTSPGPHH